MTLRQLMLIAIMLILAACGTEQAGSQVLSVTLPSDEGIQLVEPSVTPTNTPSATPTETPIPTETAIPTSTPTPPPDTATPTATTEPSPTAIEVAMQVDHYALNRPIARAGVDYVDRTYAYGDTQRGRRQVHHGVEFVNPRGTPVLAAAGGQVFYAGEDSETIFGPQADYYGRLVVIEHGITAPDGRPLYTLYGHLDDTDVETGQSIALGDRVGIIGDTGIAEGPHLHFEVRAGDPYDFDATLNPDLWIYPYPTFGTIAGRVTGPDGELLQGVAVQISRIDDENSSIRYAFTYAGDTVNSSPAWLENFTYGDLPEGDYEVLVSDDGRVLFEEVITVRPGQTTWVEIQLERIL